MAFNSINAPQILVLLAKDQLSGNSALQAVDVYYTLQHHTQCYQRHLPL